MLDGNSTPPTSTLWVSNTSKVSAHSKVRQGGQRQSTNCCHGPWLKRRKGIRRAINAERKRRMTRTSLSAPHQVLLKRQGSSSSRHAREAVATTANHPSCAAAVAAEAAARDGLLLKVSARHHHSISSITCTSSCRTERPWQTAAARRTPRAAPRCSTCAAARHEFPGRSTRGNTSFPSSLTALAGAHQPAIAGDMTIRCSQSYGCQSRMSDPGDRKCSTARHAEELPGEHCRRGSAKPCMQAASSEITAAHGRWQWGSIRSSKLHQSFLPRAAVHTP